MPDVSLLVDGKRYEGWKSVSISRSIETIANSFSLSVTDVWGIEKTPWPIREGNVCTVLVGGRPIITGRVDKRGVKLSATSHQITVSGRDKSAALVDCSVNVGKWQFRKVPTLVLLNQISAQFGVPVTVDAGVTLPVIPEDNVSVTPGDTAFSLIDKVCRFAGVIPVSDGLGGIVLTQVGLRQSGSALVEGFGVKEGSASYDVGDRFSEYIVLGQQTGGGKPVKASYIDADVEDTSRVLVIQSETATTQDKALDRARWEATVRAAKAERISVTVADWENGPGSLWSPGDLVSVSLPTLGAEGQMVIVATEMSLEGSSQTQITLARPDAYSPELLSERAWKR